jgi:hypothetical protein
MIRRSGPAVITLAAMLAEHRDDVPSPQLGALVVSRPPSGYIYRRFAGPLAQLAEQQTLNLRVRGSIPWRLTIPSSRRDPELRAASGA